MHSRRTLVLVSIILITSGLSQFTWAANIVWVSEMLDENYDGTADDQQWIDLLKSEGYNVNTPSNIEESYWGTLDEAKTAVLNAADLIIVSRGTNSSKYSDEPSEIETWNSTKAPLILQNPYFTRDSRWRWINSVTMEEGINAPVLIAAEPDHPVFKDVKLDEKNQVRFVDEQIESGIITFVAETTVGNGKLIAHSTDNYPYIVEWDKGTEFYNSSGQKAANKRMLFSAGSHSLTAGYGGKFNLTDEGKKIFLNAVSYMLSNSTTSAPASTCNISDRARVIQPFDLHWRFTKGDAPGAEQTGFDDASWQKINVPHDWSIEGPFDPNNPTGRGGAYLPSGISWYRKDFSLPSDYAGRRVFIEFDGVMANSDVWINGHHLGKRPFGYSSFRYELTGHLNFGADKSNILAVRTDTTLQPDSRWYTGQGIYRHVRMVITDPVHIDHWGIFITTPKVSAEQAVVQIQTTVVNQSDTQRKITVQTTINAPNGKSVESTESTQFISGGQRVDVMQYITVNNPQLWDLDSPNLYEAVSKIISDEVTIDDKFTAFGIRDAHFESATGFRLNGKNIKLNGVCLHHDGGAVGAAVPMRIWERRLELLRQVGMNAIRTAHNPPDPDFLDLCDRMGFLVMDEALDAWTVGKPGAKNGYNIHFNQWGSTDLRDMVLRDRNHPCVILYSTGNEIHDTPKEEHAKKILRVLVDICHKNDPSRPVTQGLFRPNVSHDYDNGLADMLDVIGTNYRDRELLAAHRDKPTRKIVCTEQNHAHGVWLDVRDNPQHAGQFIWTGVDYLGEANWPSISSRFGIIDRTGGFYPRTYQRMSWWSDKPLVHIARADTVPSHESDRRNRQRVFSNWTPLDPDNYTDADVVVYSNCEVVELILNGKSLGSKEKPQDDSPRTWSTPYEAGTIKALGKNNGQIVATHELRTAGKPAKIMLEVDRKKIAPCWDDVAQANVTIVDKNGIRCPWADDLVGFEISGPGKIIAVDNADLVSHESFQGTERHAFRGQCIAILKATAPSGKITLTASAPSLESATITIEAAAQSEAK